MTILIKNTAYKELIYIPKFLLLNIKKVFKNCNWNVHGDHKALRVYGNLTNTKYEFKDGFEAMKTLHACLKDRVSGKWVESCQKQYSIKIDLCKIRASKSFD